MEGMVARWYAANTGRTQDQFAQLAQRIATAVPRGAAVLEVAPGPGYLSVALAKLGDYRVTGLDISHTFVELPRRLAREAGVTVDLRQGSASQMPFAADTFDFLVCRAAFKNFGEPVRALQEMQRVLKPGGRGLIIDLRKDAPPEDIDRTVDGMGLNPVNRALTKQIFRHFLLRTAYTSEQFRAMLDQANFTRVDIQQVDIGFEIWLTK
jgi:ubiquinone/menaquinone biosynthesis C-methylase UbiE